jgi:hypothetical protein
VNPEQVWQLWRRVLREPALAAAVIDCSVAGRAAEWNLTSADIEILRHYTLSPGGVSWAVESYRFRLLRVTRFCVAQAAPLTARALVEAGHDPVRLAQEFVEYTGWLDRGPYVLELTLQYLSYLVEVEFGHQAGGPTPLMDILEMDIAGLRLARAQASRDSADRACDLPGRWTGRACVITVAHNVMPWLAEPGANPLSAAPAVRREVLVYFDDSISSCRLVALSDAAATVARQLAGGATIDQVATSLGLQPGHPGLASMLETFAGWAVVTPAAAPATSELVTHEG